jgi:tryptophan-rich hypothetical protein
MRHNQGKMIQYQLAAFFIQRHFCKGNRFNRHIGMARKQKFPHLVGSKWTSCQKIDGWRHFQVVNRKNQANWVFAEMVAACDPNVRFWVNARILKDRAIWQAGWRSLQEQLPTTAQPSDSFSSGCGLTQPQN